jgi:hypothetical protein
MTRVEDARKLHWYCELCERMHPIGEHDPGKSWPPAETAPRPPVQDNGPSGPALRCLCGISLWATRETAKPNVWARHVAHIEAFQAGIRSPEWRSAAEWNCESYREACESWKTSAPRAGDQPGGRCRSCGRPVAVRPVSPTTHVLIHVASEAPQ